MHETENSLRPKKHSSEKIALHTLRISDPAVSLPFYQDMLGMVVVAKRHHRDASHFYLDFVEPGIEPALEKSDSTWSQRNTLLELVHDPEAEPLDIRKQPDSSEGYWKIAISVADVDVARSRLVSQGVEVDNPRQIPDIAYLCHLNDPDGYCIELIQHDFQQHHEPCRPDSAYALGTRPTFLLITYRIKQPAASLRFYADVLGARLLSRQVVESRGFTLYFLACSDETPPNPDVEAIENREWLWQRPYTMIEFQHVWGTENQPDFAYRVGPESGFRSISFDTENFADRIRTLQGRGFEFDICSVDPLLRLKSATITDPDGYSLRLLDRR